MHDSENDLLNLVHHKNEYLQNQVNDYVFQPVKFCLSTD